MLNLIPIFDRLRLCCGVFVLFLAIGAQAQMGGGAWTPCPVTFRVQSPTNAAQDQRYWFTNGIYHCEVLNDDGAFTAGNRTQPRTEQRFVPDYTAGEIQYQAMEMAPSNENSYCIFQIHTGNAVTRGHGATTFMLFWFSNDGGSVHDYSRHELASRLGNRWFQLNVDHNLATRSISVWINRKLVWTQRDNGAGDFYFKDGVYRQKHDPTPQMDAYIKDIRLWIKSGTMASDSSGRGSQPGGEAAN
jgi:alginate lyase